MSEKTDIQFKRGTSQSLALANPILLDGEPVIETDTKLEKRGDGTTRYNDLPYISENKVDKIIGKGLSTNDLTNELKDKIESINGGSYSLVSDIKDNLTSEDINKPLSANQGKILKGFVDSINTLLTSNDTTLDELQEIVTFIKQNKQTLDNLGISNIAGLYDALLSKSNTTHNHTLLSLNEKDYSSLDNKPDLTLKVDKVSGSSLVQDTKVTSYDSHLVNALNPHGVTAQQIGSYTSLQTDTLLLNKVDKITGKDLSTNDLTNELLTLLNTKKVKNVTTDALNDRLVITYTDDTTSNLNLADVINDVYVGGASLDATTNVLTLTSSNGGADVTVNLSDFVNSGELTTALSNHYTKTEVNNITDTKVSKSQYVKISGDVESPLTEIGNGNLVTELSQARKDEINGKVSKVTSTDDAIVAFSGTTGEVKNTNLTKTDLDTYIGKFGASRVGTDLITAGATTLPWAGGVVPTVKVGISTVRGLIGAVAGTWNKIGYSATLLTTAKDTIVNAINELFNSKVTKVTSTDNALVRFNGTTGDVQDSGVIIDDSGDLELLQSDKGIILKSVGGIRYRLTVDNDGNLETEAL